MQFSVEMSPGTKRLANQLRISSRGLNAAFLNAARDIAIDLQREVVEGLSGETLDVRSGTLRRSVDTRVGIKSGAIEIAVGVMRGPATAYAEKQETGGVIKAKPGKAMAIPISRRVKTPAGVGKWPRDLPESMQRRMFMLKRPGKDPVLMLKHKRRPPELMYALKRSVTLPATYWLSGPIQTKAPQVVPRLIDKAMQRQLRTVGR